MSDEELVRRLRNTTIAIQPIFPTLRHEAADAIERLTRERDEAQHDHAAAMRASLQMKDERDAAERKVEKLRGLMQTLIDNEPSEPISDAGHTVIDLWRHEARAALAETEETNVD